MSQNSFYYHPDFKLYRKARVPENSINELIKNRNGAYKITCFRFGLATHNITFEKQTVLVPGYQNIVLLSTVPK